jgi:hypothetical protein
MIGAPQLAAAAAACSAVLSEFAQAPSSMASAILVKPNIIFFMNSPY